MNIISTNKEMNFKTPDSGVQLSATWEKGAIDFTVTKDNRAKIGYTGLADENLVIPETFIDPEDGKLYKVTSIGTNAFILCTSLTSITIPSSVTTIGIAAFDRCSALKSVTIPEGVTTIGYMAFKYCNSLISINIPAGVTAIGEGAFSYCTSLTTININKPKDSITGAPWRALVSTVNWLG